MAKRKSTGTRKRFKVFERDGFKCLYCGRTPPDVILHIDHIIPVSKGGCDDEANLATSCMECNLGKSDTTLGQTIAPLQTQLQESVERHKQFKEFNKFLMKAREQTIQDTRKLGSYWCNRFVSGSDIDKWIVGDKRLVSLRTFAAKLPVATIFNAMDKASSKIGGTIQSDERAWKYFCGICWTLIKDKNTEGAS